MRDNAVRYAEALRAEGGDVTETDYPDTVHGYLSLPGISPPATHALDETITFVRRVTSADPTDEDDASVRSRA